MLVIVDSKYVKSGSAGNWCLRAKLHVNKSLRTEVFVLVTLY